MTQVTSFFASCPRGLEELLLEEIQQFHPVKIFKQRGGIEFQLGKMKALEFLLTSRMASRVFMKLHYFRCKDMDDIYTKHVKFPWDTVMTLEQTFKVQTLFDFKAKNMLGNSMLASLKLKDALVDGLRNKTGERPSVNTTSPNLSYLLRLEGSGGNSTDLAGTLWLDLCGEPLSHRGYRPEGAPAPLRENLASALVMSTDWKPGSEALIDPMCGSGTLLIEALLIALKLPPTYLKIRKRVETGRGQFAFEQQLWFKNDPNLVKGFEELLQTHYQQILESMNTVLDEKLYGSDTDARAIELTSQSLRLAKLSLDNVNLQVSEATHVQLPHEGGPGVILTNPPYGDRLGTVENLKAMYHHFGEYLKNHAQGYRAYLFTSEPELRKSISLKASRKIPFFNGDKDCRLIKYDLY
jgi:23S rRNA G2445 N2-methylase RlmL